LDIEENTQPSFEISGIPDIAGNDRHNALLTESAPLKILGYKIKKLEEKIDFLESQKSLSLNLQLKGGVSGKDPEFMNSLTGLRPEASVSLIFDVMLDYNKIDEEIKLYKIQIEELMESMDLYKLNLHSQLESILVNMDNYREIINSNSEFIKSAALKTSEENKLYDQGRGQLTFVLQSKDEEQKAKILYLENLYKARGIFLEYIFLFDNPKEQLKGFIQG
ncbi:MAG: TolC family protein, partial [Spirochaetales bacterium]|nr:TolC family protein [Spirochaetales bacterium]